jgi:hypothetical protein
MIPTVPAMPSGKVDAGDRPSPIAAIGVFKAVDKIAAEITKRCDEYEVTRVRIVDNDLTGRERLARDTVGAAIARIEHELDDAAALLAAPEDREVDAEFAAFPAVVAASIVSSVSARGHVASRVQFGRAVCRRHAHLHRRCRRRRQSAQQRWPRGGDRHRRNAALS